MIAYIDEYKAEHGVEPICSELQVAPSTYYAAKSRPPSARTIRDATMKPKVLGAWTTNRRVYGAHKLWKQLRRQGEAIGRDQVGRLMGDLGIEGVRRGKKHRTTIADPAAERAPDLVDRDFSSTRPNQLWVTDFTYVPTWSGMAYAAFVVDVYSRMIVGWRVASTMTTDLVLDTLEMAIWRRNEMVDGVVCHSDAGSQYTSIRYTERLAEIGAAPSIGSVGDPYDCDGRVHHRPLQDRADLARGPMAKCGSRGARYLVLCRLVQHRKAPHRDRRRPTGGARSHLLPSTARGRSGRINQSA